MKKIAAHSVRETKELAARLARKISRANVVALTGELGAGKTTFVQGFARALGIRRRVISPTFLIFRKYHLPKSVSQRSKVPSTRSASWRIGTGRSKGQMYFFHVDLYRVNNPRELDVLKFKDILHSPFNIVLIEWAEKIKKILPKDTIWINFSYGRKENERFIAYRR